MLIRQQGFKDDLPEGPFVSYNLQGSKESEGAYLNGQMHGVWKYYTNQGRVKYAVEYDKGKKVKVLVDDRKK